MSRNHTPCNFNMRSIKNESLSVATVEEMKEATISRLDLMSILRARRAGISRECLKNWRSAKGAQNNRYSPVSQ
jgi:hypothetical protein